MAEIRVRFAPSPTGFLHVGNARTALFNWLFARQHNGVFILRIEDTDVARSAQKYETMLKEELQWLGLNWDEGPDIGGPYGPYRQSLRLPIYNDYTQRLLQEEKAYYCFCSPQQLEKERKEDLAAGRIPIYSGRCRHIPRQEAEQRVASGEKAAIRLKTPPKGTVSYRDLVRGQLKFDLKLIGDPILVRSSGLPAYNYAVVIDDALMKISHVIRGEDHISNTPRQLLVYQALGLAPPKFAHLSLVMGKDGARLSKRHGATAVAEFKRQGILASALFNYLALLGWAPPEGQEVLSREEIVTLFDLTRVSRSSAIFDYNKLYWLNRQHLKRLSPQEKARHAYPFLKQAKLLPEAMTTAHWQWLAKAVDCLVEGVNCLADLPREFGLFFEFSANSLNEEALAILKAKGALKVIRIFARKISKYGRFDYERFVAITREIRDETGAKGRELYHPLRVALTARASGLELDKFIPLVEGGSRLDFPRPIKNCAQRVAELLEYFC